MGVIIYNEKPLDEVQAIKEAEIMKDTALAIEFSQMLEAQDNKINGAIAELTMMIAMANDGSEGGV